MKKTYIIPKTITVAVNVQTLLIGTSETEINDGNKGDFTFSKENNSDWGDIWEE